MNASAVLILLCVGAAMTGIALDTAARPVRPAPARRPQRLAPDAAEWHGSAWTRSRSTEQQRWIAVLTVPLAAGAISVAAAIAIDERWFLGAVLLVPTWIAALAYLALSSDVNGSGGDRA